MSGGHLLCADRSGTKTHCGGMENVAETTRRRRRILQNRILFLIKELFCAESCHCDVVIWLVKMRQEEKIK